ncbi:MAG: DUF2905 domain-containing protein [Desulfomonile tiedjei]|nr:DUF2905 domain-containing protein [Desulfomonile tiedjei]
MDLQSFGRWIIFAGLIVAALGLIVWLAGKSGLPFGSLPGDISVDRPGFSFRFPLMTSIVLSIVITIVLNFLLWFFRK